MQFQYIVGHIKLPLSAIGTITAVFHDRIVGHTSSNVIAMNTCMFVYWSVLSALFIQILATFVYLLGVIFNACLLTGFCFSVYLCYFCVYNNTCLENVCMYVCMYGHLCPFHSILCFSLEHLVSKLTVEVFCPLNSNVE